MSDEPINAADPAIAELDAADPLANRRALFAVPPGVIYLDGNSLGPLSHAARARAVDVMTRQWGVSLIRGWNDHGWMDLPRSVGNKIAGLIGAEPDSVYVSDTTSINLFKLLAAALRLRPDRPTILLEAGVFPTDRYITQGLIGLLGDRHRLQSVASDRLADAIDRDTAVVVLCDVDYRSGARRLLKPLTEAAHAAGALIIWDLCHSAGALPLSLAAAETDFAVGCTYKYLNGGPGSPAYVYVAPRHQSALAQPISGWLGHAEPFRFEPDFRPGDGVVRMNSGTPPVLGLSVLDAALEAFAGVDMAQVRTKSLALADLFHARVMAQCPELERMTPLPAEQRGSQLAYRFDAGYAVIQAMVADGVIGDFRAPDIMRFGFAPLYLRYADVASAADRLVAVLRHERWRQPQFHVRTNVT